MKKAAQPKIEDDFIAPARTGGEKTPARKQNPWAAAIGCEWGKSEVKDHRPDQRVTTAAVKVSLADFP